MFTATKVQVMVKFFVSFCLRFSNCLDALNLNWVHVVHNEIKCNATHRGGNR